MTSSRSAVSIAAMILLVSSSGEAKTDAEHGYDFCTGYATAMYVGLGIVSTSPQITTPKLKEKMIDSLAERDTPFYLQKGYSSAVSQVSDQVRSAFITSLNKNRSVGTDIQSNEFAKSYMKPILDLCLTRNGLPLTR